jgi:glycerol uptake facilitator protein
MWPELVAEFIGTMILMLFGNGVVAMTVLFGNGNIPGGSWTNINLAFGLGVTLAIYAVGRISGAHINPAVTLAVAAFRGFSWVKVIPYWIAQTAGAFCGAALVFWNYLPKFHEFDPGLEKTAGVFSTAPYQNLIAPGILDQVIGTALLVMLILALIDERNQSPQANMVPLLIGGVVVAIGMSFGGMHGYAINPARDFGPRLFTVLAGFKNNGLTDGPMIFWVPIVGPLIGGLIGGAAYDLGIRRFLPAKA